MIFFYSSSHKVIYNTCAIHSQVNKQAIVACTIFPGFFRIFSTLRNKTLLDAQISEYKKKLSTIPKAYDTSQDKINPTPTATTHLHHLHDNHPLSLVTRNYRNTLAITEHTSQDHSYQQKLVSHISLHQSTIDDTYEQIVEQQHTTNFRSQTTIVLAQDEPTDWIPQPFPFLSIQHSMTLLSHFTFSFQTSSPLPVFSTNSPRTDSDDSTQTDLNKISNFNNSDVKTSDEFLHSELSPSTFSKPPFQQLTSQLPNESSPAPSSYTDATHYLSTMSSDQPDPPSPKKHN